jgi:hypothetical protein
MGFRDRFRRLIAPSWQTPPSYASSGGGYGSVRGTDARVAEARSTRRIHQFTGTFLGALPMTVVEAVIMHGSSTEIGCHRNHVGHISLDYS